MIEAPKARLKEVQRWILREILDQVPAHAAAHGFARGRSVRTNAEPHVDQHVVLGLDLKDYFASVAARRIFGIFRALGYEPASRTHWDLHQRRPAGNLGRNRSGIRPTFDPGAVLARPQHRNSTPPARGAHFARPRESGLVSPRSTPHRARGIPWLPVFALRGRPFTFSGPNSLRRRRRQVEALIAEIAGDEGFMLNRGKSRLHTAGARQSVCGVVVNVRPNVVRREYEQLKAILHNAARHGPPSQNHSDVNDFAAHLSGRIA